MGIEPFNVSKRVRRDGFAPGPSARGTGRETRILLRRWSTSPPPPPPQTDAMLLLLLLLLIILELWNLRSFPRVPARISENFSGGFLMNRRQTTFSFGYSITEHYRHT